MPKRKPSQRRHPEKTPQQPRDRLAEIRAEIQDVQQQIETKRRDGRVIRTAEDFKSLECAIAALTNRLSALLMAEATQVALDDSANRRRPAPWLKGRVTRSRIKADATSRSGRRAARSSSGRPTSAATVTAVRRLDSGEKFTSDLPYKQPESTKSSGQRELQAQACENMLRTRSAISNNPGAREVIPSTSVGWIFVITSASKFSFRRFGGRSRAARRVKFPPANRS